MLVASVARESSGDSEGRMDVGVAPSVLGVGISVPTVDSVKSMSWYSEMTRHSEGLCYTCLLPVGLVGCLQCKSRSWRS